MEPIQYTTILLNKTLEVYREFLDEWVSSKHLVLVNTFLEAAPQSTLQIYLILLRKDGDTLNFNPSK